MAGLGRPPVGEVEDLASLARLDEKSLLDELRTRYNRDVIYVRPCLVVICASHRNLLLFCFVCARLFPDLCWRYSGGCESFQETSHLRQEGNVSEESFWVDGPLTVMWATPPRIDFSGLTSLLSLARDEVQESSEVARSSSHLLCGRLCLSDDAGNGEKPVLCYQVRTSGRPGCGGSRWLLFWSLNITFLVIRYKLGLLWCLVSSSVCFSPKGWGVDLAGFCAVRARCMKIIGLHYLSKAIGKGGAVPSSFVSTLNTVYKTQFIISSGLLGSGCS